MEISLGWILKVVWQGERGSEVRQILEEEGYGDILNYNYSEGDIVRKSSWGEKKGKPVLVDAGSLSIDDISSEHRITKVSKKLGDARRQKEELEEGIEKYGGGIDKESLPKLKRQIAEMEDDVNEWNEIQFQRKQYAKKGEKGIKKSPYEKAEEGTLTPEDIEEHELKNFKKDYNEMRSPYDLRDEDDQSLDYDEEYERK